MRAYVTILLLKGKWADMKGMTFMSYSKNMIFCEEILFKI